MTLPTLTRLPGWPERLIAYIHSNRAGAFAYGLRDCIRFAAGAVEAETGADVLQGRLWSDRATAVQLLRAYGGLAGAVDSVLPRLQTSALAMRGDIVLMQAEVAGAVRRWIAVCEGAHAWAPGATALVSRPMTDARIAWGVGHG